MAQLENLNEDLDIISKLGDNPGSDDGLTTEAFKAKFDEAGNILKTYLNEVVVPYINGLTEAGTAVQPKDMGGFRIVNIGAPVNLNDATSKKYVDTAIKTATSALNNSMAVTLNASSWIGTEQTVSVSGVTTSNSVIVAADSSSRETYTESGVYCSGQSDGSLTFTAEELPTSDLSVNILIIN